MAAAPSFGDITLGASTIYELATAGTQNWNLGDILRGNVGHGWSPGAALSGAMRLTFMLEAVGEWREKAQIDGATDANIGGTQMFAAPGLRATWSDAWSCYVSLSLPLVENRNREQADTDWRFTTAFALLL